MLDIIGKYLLNKPRDILYKLAKSKNLWEKRIAMLATFAFIREKQFDDTLKIAKMLLQDEHDLIHKAVGWMLRELGKRGGHKELLAFLDKYATIMPRTALRYSLERLSDGERRHYMALKASN